MERHTGDRVVWGVIITSDLFTDLLDQENYNQGYTIRLQKKRERKLLRAIRKSDIAKVNALADGVHLMASQREPHCKPLLG
ncbi:hypothetical protein N7453_007125 [Penicillium expansum]|nr:hypothetical protein N7453_007125 [Penicillium expansum]